MIPDFGVQTSERPRSACHNRRKFSFDTSHYYTPLSVTKLEEEERGSPLHSKSLRISVHSSEVERMGIRGWSKRESKCILTDFKNAYYL